MGEEKIPFRLYVHVVAGLAGFCLFIALMIAAWQWIYRPSVVVTYGAPDQTYFSPDGAAEGDDIDICFKGIDWKAICPSKLVLHITPFAGPRLDWSSREIDVPDEVGPVKAKCRAVKVPRLGAHRTEGPAIVSGHVESECSPLDHWWKIYTKFPPTKLDWRRK